MSAPKNNGPIIDPALCRCCRAIKKCRVLTAEYTWMDKKEVYADMIMDCFGILLSHVDEIERDSGVCATCVVRLRDASAFRRQVLTCEEMFLHAKLEDKDTEEPKKALDIEPKVEPKDDVSEHESIGAMDHDDAMSLDNYSADDGEIKPETKDEKLEPEQIEAEPLPKCATEDSDSYASSSDSDKPIKRKRSKKSKTSTKSNGSTKKKGKAAKAKKEKAATNMSLCRVYSDAIPDDFQREMYHGEYEFSDKEKYQKVAEYQEVTESAGNKDAIEDDFDRRLPSPRPSTSFMSPTRRDPPQQAEPLIAILGDCPDSSASAINIPAEAFLEQSIVIGIYDEDGEEVMEDSFLVPDAHEVYARAESESDVYVRESVRRGVRRRGGRSRGRSIKTRRGERWNVGDPLECVYRNDYDVPPELAKIVKDVRIRQKSTQGNKEKMVRIREEDGPNEHNDRESQEDHESHVATDGTGSLLREEYLRFDWLPMETFRGEEEVFQPQYTGSVRRVASEYDAFRSYWNDTILNQIVDQTNQNATRITSATFRCDWQPTNANEILCLFAFWMMLGAIRMPTIKSCFSTDPVLRTDIFRRIFTQKRYTSLTRALHFVDADPADNNSSSNSDSDVDRLHRLRPILDHLNLQFQENYILSKDICIDESLTFWKDRLKFKQYIRSKAAKFGIKTFELCESSTGYLWSFIVSGKDNEIDSSEPTVLKSTSVVLQLMKPLLNKGHRLFMDNWYNSPVLARYLKLNRTDCVGTLRPTRQDVPVLLSHAPLKQGQYVVRHSGDVCVLAWQDKKRITMLSTCHGAHTALSRVTSKPPTYPLQFKPQMVLDYNKSMGGVDLKDQMLEPYLVERKRGAKWYIKLFKRLLNCSILNARILLQSSSNTAQDHLNFRIQLVNAILAKHLSLCPPTHRRSVTVKPTGASHIIVHGHWPVHMEPTAYEAARNRQHRQRCVVCLSQGRKTQTTAHMCETCKVPLCVVNCFKSFHSS